MQNPTDGLGVECTDRQCSLYCDETKSSLCVPYDHLQIRTFISDKPDLSVVLYYLLK